MVALNTRQRDMLRLLLESDEPTVVHQLAAQMQLTPRQVNYSLKGVKVWLSQRGTELYISPGVGIEIHCTQEQREALIRELESDRAIELILSSDQRRQLIAFSLLSNSAPYNLADLQNENRVSRSTILKDLEDVEKWLAIFDLKLSRKPNYGIWVEGNEHLRRQALVSLLWGETHFENPLWGMGHTNGLEFSLKEDAHLLDILQVADRYSASLGIDKTLSSVAFAEADMGGRFTDKEVLHLALALAVQFKRIDSDNWLTRSPIYPEDLDHFSTSLVWKVSHNLFENHYGAVPNESDDVLRWEIAWIAIHLLAGPKNDRWPGDSETEQEFEHLIAILLKIVSEAYEMPALKFDTTLRDGFIINLIPACLRHRYQLWSPSLQPRNLLLRENYPFEYEVAQLLADEVMIRAGIKLPDIEVSNLALLLRAAYIRERPQELKDVLVVCPSGMATAQLLVARLNARFTRLGKLKVVSVRELSDQRFSTVDLIISTVPLSDPNIRAEVIRVHPLLLSEDIAAITQWLAHA